MNQSWVLFVCLCASVYNHSLYSKNPKSKKLWNKMCKMMRSLWVITQGFVFFLLLLLFFIFPYCLHFNRNNKTAYFTRAF